MLENVLERKAVSERTAVTVKMIVAAGCVALAVVLPQIAHLAVGAKAGIMLLPMYLPAVLGACVLGSKYGAFVGVLSPVLSYLLTSAFGNAMPALERLPFMAAELLTFAVVCGAFSKKISDKPALSFAAVALSALCGRGMFLLLSVIFKGVVSFTPAVILSQILTGIPGLLLQLVLVPVTVMWLNKCLNRSKNND